MVQYQVNRFLQINAVLIALKHRTLIKCTVKKMCMKTQIKAT